METKKSKNNKYLIYIKNNTFFHIGFNKKYILLDNIFYEIPL